MFLGEQKNTLNQASFALIFFVLMVIQTNTIMLTGGDYSWQDNLKIKIKD